MYYYGEYLCMLLQSSEILVRDETNCKIIYKFLTACKYFKQPKLTVFMAN